MNNPEGYRLRRIGGRGLEIRRVEPALILKIVFVDHFGTQNTASESEPR